MKTLEDKLVKYGFVKLNYFWYFWYVVLQGRGVYTKETIGKILYSEMNIGKAKSLVMECSDMWKVFKTNKYLYVSTINSQIYRFKL